MNINALVAFIRNGLCCVKDLGLFSGSFLWDSKYTALFYSFPEPYLSKTTPLEAMIGVAQFYAFVTLVKGGVDMMYKGYAMRQSCKRVRSFLPQQQQCKHPTGYRIITTQLAAEDADAFRLMWEGFWVMCVGWSFVWLTANSFHVIEAGVIGGVQGLIHALSVAEIGLLVSLYYMLKDGSRKLAKSKRISKQLIPKLTESKGRLGNVVNDDFFNNETYADIVFSGWTPCWNTTAVTKQDAAMVNKEIQTVQQTVNSLLSKDKPTSKKETDDKLQQAVVLATQRLAHEALTSKIQGSLDYLYFVLNGIAFYGYLICVLVFYLPDHNPHPVWSYMKYGLNNTDADWTGNFAGDAMWTIEPFTILLAPHILSALSTQQSKPSKLKQA